MEIELDLDCLQMPPRTTFDDLKELLAVAIETLKVFCYMNRVYTHT